VIHDFAAKSPQWQRRHVVFSSVLFLSVPLPDTEAKHIDQADKGASPLSGLLAASGGGLPGAALRDWVNTVDSANK